MNELQEKLLMDVLEGVSTLKAISSVHGERLDQYNKQLEIHIRRTEAVEQIAEAASEQAYSAFQVAQTQIERLDIMKASLLTIESMTKKDHDFLENNKKSLSAMAGIYIWLKYSGYAIAALSPITYGLWLVFTYLNK